MDIQAALKHIGAGSLVIFVLSGCAGGSDVQMPDVLEPVPALSAFNPHGKMVVGKTPDITLKTFSTTGSGEVVSYQVREKQLYGDGYDTVEKFYYQTKDGTIYPFTEFGAPMQPGSFAPDKNYFTTHDLQPTDNGGKIFACCNGYGRRDEAVYVDDMRYGVWMDPAGNPNFFVGGILAPLDKMQGVDDEHAQPRGKATYHVWAFREKNGEVVASSYRPKQGFSWSPSSDAGVISRVTVNFNTAKLGGTIKGNDDFGPDISLDDVTLSGNQFSGSASSGGHSGEVKGGLFGRGSEPDAWYKETAGREIGGTITFQDNKALDSVFGGSRAAEDADDQSADLTPVQE